MGSACLVTGFEVAGGRSFDTGPVHGTAGVFTSLGTLGVVASVGFTLIRTVELSTVLFPALAVAIRHTIAVNRVVLPVTVVDSIVGIDVVVTVDVDVDVVIVPVTFAPQRPNDSHTGPECQPGHQSLTWVIRRWRWIVRGR
ncbi:hypothetical protein D3C84_474030 [compost metagenome]